jgi:hypothetical protein
MIHALRLAAVLIGKTTRGAGVTVCAGGPIWGVSRTTVRAALATLASEGLVLTRKGFGSYVRSRPPLRRVSSTHRHAWHRDSGKPGFGTETIA